MQNISESGGESESGEEPVTKKQRKLTEADLGGPIEDEETARKKLVIAGFDPDKNQPRMPSRTLQVRLLVNFS